MDSKWFTYEYLQMMMDGVSLFNYRGFTKNIGIDILGTNEHELFFFNGGRIYIFGIIPEETCYRIKDFKEYFWLLFQVM